MTSSRRVPRFASVAALLLAACGGAAATGAGSTTGASRPGGAAAAGPFSADGDHDGDGIADLFDLCPSHAEDGQDPHPFDGCPRYLDPARLQPSRARAKLHQVVHVQGDQIAIGEQVLFQTGSADIDPRSDTLLKNVAQTIKDHPDLDFVEVAGHADKTGGDAANKALTDQRATAVMQRLVTNGVAASRLRALGYGSYCPLDPADDEAAYAKNRRVEFRILRRGGKDTTTEWGGCPAALAKGMTIPKLPPAPATPPPPPQYDIQPDVLYHRCTDDEDDCRTMCAAGSAESCVSLAKHFVKDPAEQVALKERACQLGAAWPSCEDAAKAYAEGQGVAKDVAHALAIAKKGCDDYGEDLSCSIAGDYLKDTGSKADAVAYWKRACDRRVALACLARALYDDSMTGPEKLALDVKTCSYDEVACSDVFEGLPILPSIDTYPRAELVAVVHSGCEVSNGSDVAKDAACEWLKKMNEKPGEWTPPAACSAGDERTCVARCTEQGDMRACTELGVAYLYGVHEPVIARRAARFLASACTGRWDAKDEGLFLASDAAPIAQGDTVRATACELFGAAMGDIDEDDLEYIEDPAKLACNAGLAAGCARAASFELDELGDYDEVAPPIGFATLDKQCGQGVAWACAEAGRAAKNGLGTAKDAARAKGYFDRACAAGLKSACGKS